MTYTNDLGQSVSFTNRTELSLTSILFTDADGLYGLPAEVYVLTQSGQDGAVYEDSKLSPREVTISGKIVRNVTANRMAMLRAMNPKIPGTLTLKRGSFIRKLRCVVQEAPSSPPKRGDVFTFTLKAPNPYWLNDQESRQEVAVWESLFEWPLDVPESGISFGERTTNLITNVVNPGEATIGMRITLRATNDVENPEIAHVLTFKKMRLSMHLYPGDTATINTGFGEKQVLIRRAGQAEPENAMDYLNIDDPDFQFIQLVPGDNLIRYDADGGVDNLNVTIHYSPGFLGV